MLNSSNVASGRIHIVLVPGFAGFDALGQVHYYAGTSSIYQDWLAEQPQPGPGRRSVLHYFDSLPSGAVATRSARLHAYLAKRIARNEFQQDDQIVLVGHSTGGLDIRHLLMDLATPDEVPVNGKMGEAIPVDNQKLLKMITRVVFLSTPHYGSNIADDWLTRTWLVRALLRTGLLLFYGSLRVPSGLLSRVLGPRPSLDAWYAIQDALLEAHDMGIDDPIKSADAREASAQISLWIKQMAYDFSVLTDLGTEQNARKAEQDWPRSVLTRSYATVSPVPPAWSWRSWLRGRQSDDAAPSVDLIYRLVHLMTGRGKFRERMPIAEDWFVDPGVSVGPLDHTASDGIVNTASMFWKHGGDTKLVLADHGDIIGHFRRDPKTFKRNGGGRRFTSYDFFESGSSFDEHTFKAIWREIFTFCCDTLPASAHPNQPAVGAHPRQPAVGAQAG